MEAQAGVAWLLLVQGVLHLLEAHRGCLVGALLRHHVYRCRQGICQWGLGLRVFGLQLAQDLCRATVFLSLQQEMPLTAKVHNSQNAGNPMLLLTHMPDTSAHHAACVPDFRAPC